MFSWHSLHSLYAEASLVAIALAIFAYTLLGGKNKWIRTHGVILTTYYAVGGLAYDELEGWPFLDTTYFLTVTITTVGYGDLTPATTEGKLFTVVYALVGIIFVFAALSPLVDLLMTVKDFILKPFTPPEPDETDEDGQVDIDDLRKRGNWGFKFTAALAGPFIIFLLGLCIGFTVMGYDLVDGVYWSMITMTTIGYGDLSASTAIQQAVLCIYLLMAVAALADALGVVQSIATAKMLCETDFAVQADKLLLGEAGGPQPNPEETLTEAEFLISVLKDNGIVDDITVRAIRLQFAHITRHDTSANDNKVLDDRMVFLELKSQGRIAHKGDGLPTTTPAGHKIDYVDTRARDGGFKEWKTVHWLPRVFSGVSYGAQVRMDPNRDKASQQTKTAPPPPKARKSGKGGAYARLADESDSGPIDVSVGTPAAAPVAESETRVHKEGELDAGTMALWCVAILLGAGIALMMYRDYRHGLWSTIVKRGEPSYDPND